MLRNKIPNYKIKALSLIICILILIYGLSFAQKQFTYDAKGKRDPFIPLVTPDGRLLRLEQEEGIKGISLDGILYDKHGLSFAIVSGVIVKIGDTIGDYQVLKIEEDQVIFIKEGEPQVMKLKKED